ncbi:AMP-binding enzyme [Desulfosarcina cetonica]|nr:AMP-binding enzyme [Desulfosarcina cetonica]
MNTICTLRTILKRNIEHNPDKLAFVENDKKYSFLEFSNRVFKMGNTLLNMGLNKGDRIALLAENCIEAIEFWLNGPCAGLISVPLNFRLAPREILITLSDCQAAVLIVQEKYIPFINKIKSDLKFVKHFIYIGNRENMPDDWQHYEDLLENSSSDIPNVSINENDIAALVYTSGTTGSPKGTITTHRNLYHAGRAYNLNLKLTRNEFGILAVPLFHIAGGADVMLNQYGGNPCVIMNKWDVVDFLSLVEKYKVTTGMLITPMVIYLSEYPDVHKYDISSLKSLHFAGAPLSAASYEKVLNKFGNVFYSLFGATETTGPATLLLTDDVEKAMSGEDKQKLGSCGRAFIDTEIQVVDENDNICPPGKIGEMRVRGLGITSGYWNKDEQTKSVYRGGWYYPLDICMKDKEGYVYVIDRKKDMIISGGENVYPTEVESVLCNHPAVKEVSVIGQPDPKWGEIVTAVVVKTDDEEVTDNELRDYCRQYIGGYKVPKKIIFLNELPKSSIGKILRYKLREGLKSK